jgi:hypothetical protein
MNRNLRVALVLLVIAAAGFGSYFYLKSRPGPNARRTVVVAAGAMMLIGGAGQLWFAMRLRPGGAGPWRGAAVSAAAMVTYGILAVTGLALNGTAMSAVLVWAIAAAFFFGWWLTRRETARQVR